MTETNCILIELQLGVACNLPAVISFDFRYLVLSWQHQISFCIYRNPFRLNIIARAYSLCSMVLAERIPSWNNGLPGNSGWRVTESYCVLNCLIAAQYQLGLGDARSVTSLSPLVWLTTEPYLCPTIMDLGLWLTGILAIMKDHLLLWRSISSPSTLREFSTEISLGLFHLSVYRTVTEVCTSQPLHRTAIMWMIFADIWVCLQNISYS